MSLACAWCLADDPPVVVHDINGRCDRCGGTDWADPTSMLDTAAPVCFDGGMEATTPTLARQLHDSLAALMADTGQSAEEVLRDVLDMAELGILDDEPEADAWTNGSDV